jgi:hypothetical protein
VISHPIPFRVSRIAKPETPNYNAGFRSNLRKAGAAAGRMSSPFPEAHRLAEIPAMSKTHRKLKKANHGKRPCNAQARRAKRRVVKT